jgi:hypothetical protein
MIIRVFAARLQLRMRNACERLCRESALPLLWAQPGVLSARIADTWKDRPDEIVVVSFWQDLASLRAVVGERWQEAMIVPGEADLLHEVSVRHYDESYSSLVAMWRAMSDVVKRRELAVAGAPLTDVQWERLRPLLPAAPRVGRPCADDRRTLEGILYVLRSGCRWQDVPATFGSPITCWRRFQRWEADGTWERLWRELFSSLDVRESLAWALAFLDTRYVPTRSDTAFAPTTLRRRVSSI